MKSQKLQALDALNDQLIEAGAWMKALESHDNPNPLVWPVARLLERIEVAAAELETHIRREEVQV